MNMSRFAVGWVAVCVALLSVIGHADAATIEWSEATPPVFADGFLSASSEVILYSVSCVSAGDCTAVGSAQNSDSREEAFTMTSTDGVWGQAEPAVFADGVQSSTPFAEFYWVSCVSAGDCTAVGTFWNRDDRLEAFTMTSTDGVWGQGEPAAFASGVEHAVLPSAYFNSVSCASAGNCTAVGTFRSATGREAFTMTSNDGVWGQPTPAVFANGVQNTSPNAYFRSVSCASAGNCTAVGYFWSAAGGYQAFTMTSNDGVWGQARPAVFASGVQNASPTSFFNSVSCVPSGKCIAVGRFKNAAGGYEAITMTLADGVWALPEAAVFSSGVQHALPNGSFSSVSCAASGKCTAVGRFKSAAGDDQPFTMTSTDGVWAQARPAVFASGVQNTAPDAEFNSVSCAVAGYCTAVGEFLNAAGSWEAFTMTSTDGAWGQARPAVFASGVQDTSPYSQLDSVSCGSVGSCTAVGPFRSAEGNSASFTMTSTATLTITYDSHGGSTVSGGDGSTTTGGTISALPTDPTRDGYTFTGWFTAASGGVQVTTGSPHGLTEDFTLHAQWSLDSSGSFVALTPARIMDTRSGEKVGELDGSGSVRELQVTGAGGVPSSGVSAVALNVTAVSTETNDFGGFVTVFPCGTRPDASNLNFTSGMTIPNSVIAPVSSDGKVCFYVYGKAHLLADVSGYFSSGFESLTPARILDTRSGDKVGEIDGSGSAYVLQVGGRSGIPSTEIAESGGQNRSNAVALNVTVVDGEAGDYGGYVTVYPCGTRPDASNLNFTSGMTIPNSVIAPVSDDGKVCFYVYGKAHLLADVSGYFSSGFESLTPDRIMDTRSGDMVGELDGSGSAYELQVTGAGGVPSSGVSAVALNVTAVSTETNDFGGFVTVFPCGTRPDASNLNFTTGMTIPNSVIAPVSDDGKVCFYVYGKAHLLADVSGHFG